MAFFAPEVKARVAHAIVCALTDAKCNDFQNALAAYEDLVRDTSNVLLEHPEVLDEMDPLELRQWSHRFDQESLDLTKRILAGAKDLKGRVNDIQLGLQDVQNLEPLRVAVSQYLDSAAKAKAQELQSAIEGFKRMHTGES